MRLKIPAKKSAPAGVRHPYRFRYKCNQITDNRSELKASIRGVLMANKSLGKARQAKNDEFYTQYSDIESEISAYFAWEPTFFRNKTVLLPCDDPEWSNFTKYFAQRFQELGLKRLVSTSYAPRSKPRNIPYHPTLFEMESPEFSQEKTEANGKIFTLTRDKTGDKVIDFHDLEWSYLNGDGDFRSEEITALRNEADIVITNPPFSLFREFLAWLIEGKVHFSMIGNMSAITYKEVFPLIKDNKLWLGKGFKAGNAYFSSPVLREYAPGVYDKETHLVKFRNVIWMTNIEHGRRHEPLTLMTMSDNLRFNRAVKDVGYQQYENYDAIEIPRTDAIPSDYEGVMGVPISFLDKYNPDQFQIVGMAKRGAGDPALKTKVYTASDYPNYSDLNAGPVLVKREGLINTFPRILIKHKR